MSETSRNSEIDDGVDEARETAEEIGLVYVSDQEPGIRRRAVGGDFEYVNAKGQPVRNEAVLKRIRSLAVPPAYTDVWICPKPNGHIQATGRDARGRKQYRYHPRWMEARDQGKFEHVLRFASTLPALRERVRADMAKRGLPREKVLATIVNLLEATLIRVGNEDYARDNQSYGLTTLRNGHVEIEGGELRFRFKGKSGKLWNLRLKDRRVAKIVRGCQELPGQHLFEFVDDEGVRAIGEILRRQRLSARGDRRGRQPQIPQLAALALEAEPQFAALDFDVGRCAAWSVRNSGCRGRNPRCRRG